MIINFANKGKVEVLQELKKFINNNKNKVIDVTLSLEDILDWINRKIVLIHDIDKRNNRYNKNYEELVKRVLKADK